MKPKWFIRRIPASLPGFFAIILAVVALLGMPTAATAQEGAIGGQVTSIADGENLIGVQVFIPGTSFGTLTDDGGRFRITGVPAGDYTLRASIIGFQGSEQPVTVVGGEVATVDFVLEISAVALDEVVATITGERRRRELSADISTIEAVTVVENTRTNDVTSVLKGQATGVFVRRSSGTVGTGADVRIRGSGSIDLSTQPLYVIDGAIIDGQANNNDPLTAQIGVGGQDFSRLVDLNPDEIETIEIIKGPAASALWGARGNAGVVVITTKKGAAGATRWNFRADLGVNNQANGFVAEDSPTSTVKGQWTRTGWDSSAFGYPTDTLYTMNLMEEFQDDILQNGLYQNYNGNVTGGAGVWNYFGSVAYNDEEGTMQGNALQKFNFRANFGVDPSDKLNISFSNGFTSNEVNLPQNDNNGFGYIGVTTVGFPWLHEITATDPVTGETVQTCPDELEGSKALGVPTSELGFCGTTGGFFGGRRPEKVASIVTAKETQRYTGSGNVTWNPVQRWTNRFTLGYDYVSDQTVNLFPVDLDRPFGGASDGFIGKPFTNSRNLTMQGTTSWTQPLTSSLDFEVVGGAQWFRRTINTAYVEGLVFPASSPAVNNSVTQNSTDGFQESKSIGFFVQGTFQWDNRLFLNGAVRWDNNSAQGEFLGVQTYPKFGASYVALEGQGLFNMLRFRGAWGQSGTLPGTNDSKALVAITQVALEGTDQLGIAPNRPGNPLLAPEVGNEWEAGLDLSMFQDRIGLVATYYNQKTKNTVVEKELAPSVGFPSDVFTNIGETSNKGFEIALDALVVAAENFSWDLRVLASNNTNTITELTTPIIFGTQRHQQGLPFASYVDQVVVMGAGGPEVLTCDATPGSWSPADAAAGNAGAKGDYCDPTDNARFLGDPNAHWEGSLQTTFTVFKYVQLYALFDFQNGHQLWNLTGSFLCEWLGGGTCLDKWQRDAEGNLTERAELLSFASDIQTDSFFILDSDFAKWRTAQIRFDMPPSVTRFLKVNGLQFQFIGENLVTWTDYSGLDPEFNQNGQAEQGRREFLTLPFPRRFIGSINIFF